MWKMTFRSAEQATAAARVLADYYRRAARSDGSVVTTNAKPSERKLAAAQAGGFLRQARSFTGYED